MLSVLIETLGCKLNQLESESFSDSLTKAGFKLFDAACGNSPSLIIINTCTVTSKADQKTRRIIRKALRDYPDSIVLVTGCYAQLNFEEIYKLDEDADNRLFVLKGRNKDKLLDFQAIFNSVNFQNEENDSDLNSLDSLKSALERALKIICKEDNENVNNDNVFHFSPEHFSGHTRGFLKIQDGCNKHCAYCIIRLARGPSVSLSAQTVLSRLRLLEKQHGEAVITGVNICQYQDFSALESQILPATPVKSITSITSVTPATPAASAIPKLPITLPALLDYLLSGTTKIALRLSSLSPENIDENFIKILSNNRIRPHFHLSVQSGSDYILEKMGRSYNSKTVERAVTLLRSVKSDPFIACDIITGFPGETDEEFDITYNLCKKLNFAWIHVFPFSRREGTPAYSYSDNVKESIKTDRTNILSELAKKGRAEYVKRWIGKEVSVLIEKKDAALNNLHLKLNLNEADKNIINNKFSICRGTSENYLKLLVLCNTDKDMQGAILNCRIQQAQDVSLNINYDALAVSR